MLTRGRHDPGGALAMEAVPSAPSAEICAVRDAIFALLWNSSSELMKDVAALSLTGGASKGDLYEVRCRRWGRGTDGGSLARHEPPVFCDIASSPLPRESSPSLSSAPTTNKKNSSSAKGSDAPSYTSPRSTLAGRRPGG